jgi:hypothetical protein
MPKEELKILLNKLAKKENISLRRLKNNLKK